MTKEELTQQNGALSGQIGRFQVRDNELRERFSKVLNSPNERDGLYVSRASHVTYSWEEIFYEIGKLMPDGDRIEVRRFDATLDILLEKLAHANPKSEIKKEVE